MREFDLSIQALNKVIYEDTSFQDALKSVFSNNSESNNCRPTVAALTGCVLRHYYLFEYLLKKIDNLSSEYRCAIYLALGNAYFAKRINFIEIEELLRVQLDENTFNFVKELLDRKDKPEELIPSEIQKGSLLYLSLRFNTPEWVLKIWKHFGASATYKMLRKNLKPSTPSVRVRNSLIKTNDVLNDSAFSESPIPDVLFYNDKSSLKKNGFYVRNEVFLEKPALKMILDKFALRSDNSELFIFNGNPNPSASLEIIESYQDRIPLNIGVYDLANYPVVSKTKYRMNYKNINLFAADPLSMQSYISGPQDLVICYPNSTNFDLIRDNPDYLLHFNRDQMDLIIKQQEEALEGCSKYVADQGNLLYIVPTVSKKECVGQIVNFLKKHEDFHVVEQKQLFPFDDGDSSMYYCLLKKGMKVEKDSVPQINILSDNQTAANISSAKEN